MSQVVSPPRVKATARRAAKASPFLEPPSHLRRFVRVKRFMRRLGRLVLRLFSGIWRFVRQLWLAVIFGGLVLAVVAEGFINGTSHLADVANYAVVQAIVANPITSTLIGAGATVVLFLAYLADRRVSRDKLRKSEYIMQRVDEVAPDDVRLFSLVPTVYLRRRGAATGSHADEVAHKVIRAAARRRRSDTTTARGIWVIGRPTQG